MNASGTPGPPQWPANQRPLSVTGQPAPLVIDGRLTADNRPLSTGRPSIKGNAATQTRVKKENEEGARSQTTARRRGAIPLRGLRGTAEIRWGHVGPKFGIGDRLASETENLQMGDGGDAHFPHVPAGAHVIGLQMLRRGFANESARGHMEARRDAAIDRLMRLQRVAEHPQMRPASLTDLLVHSEGLRTPPARTGALELQMGLQHWSLFLQAHRPHVSTVNVNSAPPPTHQSPPPGGGGGEGAGGKHPQCLFVLLLAFVSAQAIVGSCSQHKNVCRGESSCPLMSCVRSKRGGAKMLALREAGDGKSNGDITPKLTLTLTHAQESGRKRQQHCN